MTDVDKIFLMIFNHCEGWISLYNCTVGSRLGKMPKRGALAKKCSSKSSNEDRCDPHFFVSLTHLFRRNCHFWDILSEAFYWHILSETFRVRHFVEWYIFETFWVRHFIDSFWVRHFKWDIFWDILSETFLRHFEYKPSPQNRRTFWIAVQKCTNWLPLFSTIETHNLSLWWVKTRIL